MLAQEIHPHGFHHNGREVFLLACFGASGTELSVIKTKLLSGDTTISHSFYIIPQEEIEFLYSLWHDILFIVTTPPSIYSKFLSPNCQCSMIKHVHNRGHTVTACHHGLPSNWISPYTQSDPAKQGGAAPLWATSYKLTSSS